MFSKIQSLLLAGFISTDGIGFFIASHYRLPEKHLVLTRQILYPKVWDICTKPWDIHPKAWDVRTKAWDVEFIASPKDLCRGE